MKSDEAAGDGRGEGPGPLGHRTADAAPGDAPGGAGAPASADGTVGGDADRDAGWDGAEDGHAGHGAEPADLDDASAPPLAAGWRPSGPVPPGLHLVATPIGNAGDITLRALDLLARADVLAAEDTRTLRRLMEIHGVPLRGRPLIAYNDRNGAQRRPGLMALLREGKSLAYCSDAGTPLVSDPGWKLAAEAAAENLPLTAAPGASAALAALCLSGLPSDRFLFEGFLPTKAGARKRLLETLAKVPATLIFFEAPRRAAQTLAEMAQTLGPDRDAAFCRELTKRFEEVRRAPLAALAEDLAAGPVPKGEAVIVVGPPAAGGAAEVDPDALLRDAMTRGSVKQAAREVADATGMKRSDLYARALALRDAADPEE